MKKPELPGIAAMTQDARRRKEEMAKRARCDDAAVNNAVVDSVKSGADVNDADNETAPKPDLRLKKIMLTRPELAVTMATTAAKLGTNDSEGL